MDNVTVYFNPKSFDRLVSKIEDRLSELKTNHHKGKDENSIKELIFAKIAKDIARYQPSGDNSNHSIIDHAFVFGEVLNDTVYMLTPVAAVGGNVIEHQFRSSLAPGASEKYQVDFYVAI